MIDRMAQVHMRAVELMSENAAMRAQIRWFRKMLRKARTLIETGMDDEDFASDWLSEYHKEMRSKRP